MHTKSTCRSTTVSGFFSNYSNIYIDKKIQRGAVWNKTNKKEFIQSTLNGLSVSPIIIADIFSCMNYCLGLGDDFKESYEYYKDLYDKGYKYISIDGNNRTSCLLEFLGGEKFSPLNFDDSQRKIYNSNLSITEIIMMTKSELHRVALVTNKGVPWNQQETRNCMESNVSDFVRKITDRMSAQSGYISGINIQRMGDDELYAYFLTYHQFEYNDFISKTVNQLYNKKELNNEKEFEMLIELWGKLILYFGQKGSKIKKSFSFNLFVFLLNLNRKHRMVLKKGDISKFADEYERLEGIRLVENINLSSSNKSYWSEINRNTSKKIKEKFERIYSDFGENINKYFVKLDEKRLYTEEDKIMKYVETNGVVKTLDGGEENPTVLQAINSNLYHADHSEVPYSKGGPTTLENMQLLRKEDNLKKSNK